MFILIQLAAGYQRQDFDSYDDSSSDTSAYNSHTVRPSPTDELLCKYKCSEWESRLTCRESNKEQWHHLNEQHYLESKRSIRIVNENNCTIPLKISRNSFEHFQLLELFTATKTHITQVSNIDLRSSPQLQSLNLSSNEITELTPFIFGWALHLQIIDLSFNQISEIDDNAFDKNNIQYDISDRDSDYSNERDYPTTTPAPSSRLRHLDIHQLYLNNNKLTVLKAVWFSTLRNLKILTVDANFLKSVNFNQVLQFNINLRVLHASQNYLNEINDFSPVSFWALDDLDLSNNPLNNSYNAQLNFGVIVVSNLKVDRCRIGWKTRRFDASWNNITEVIVDRLNVDGIMQTSLLTELNLSHNQIYSIVNITDFPKLTHLDLSHNLLENIPTGSFAGLHNLEILRLDYNNLQIIDYESFRSLARLTSLHLAHNRLRKFKLQTILNNLVDVDLFGNQLSSIDLDLRRKAPNLKRIYAGNNLWDCNILTTAILVLNTDDIRLLSSANALLVNRGEFNTSIKGIGCSGSPKPTAVDDYNIKPSISLELKERLDILMDQKIHEFETRILDVITNITNDNMKGLVERLNELTLKISSTNVAT